MKEHHLTVEQIILGVTVFLFLWSLFYTIELIKLVMGVAVTSVEYQKRLMVRSRPTSDTGSLPAPFGRRDRAGDPSECSSPPCGPYGF